MRIYLGADHAGFERKEMIKSYLQENGFEVKDFGAEQYNEQDDYPDFAYPLAKAVAEDDQYGILFCGNAQGVCIVANKVDGIRAALGYSVYGAKTSREDDDSNILCVPARALNDDEAKEIVSAWLEASFSEEERHQRRIQKIKQIEQEQSL